MGYSVSDSLALSRRVDAMFVVVNLNVIRRPLLRELHRTLETTSCAKFGAVVAGSSRLTSDAYGYGYGYASGYASV